MKETDYRQWLESQDYQEKHHCGADLQGDRVLRNFTATSTSITPRTGWQAL